MTPNTNTDFLELDEFPWSDEDDAVSTQQHDDAPQEDEGEPSQPDKPAQSGAEPERKSQATLMVELASEAELWHTPGQGDAYATIIVDEHRENWPIRSRAFKLWLCARYYATYQRTPGSQAVQDAIGVLEGKALFAGETFEVALRVAGHDGRLYLDLADDAWRAVEIDADGWRIVDSCPVRFRRVKALLPLPVPQTGGDIGSLRKFINCTDDDWPLILGWLVAAFRPTGPYPILLLHGEQGSAKTTSARALRALVDANSAAVRCEPRNPQDLAIAANNGWVVATDNLSHVPGWLSDALCRLATGGGFATRTLYENDEESIFNATRPVILTGIEEVANRSDLLDRCLLPQLPRIPDEQRRPESEFWESFGVEAPAILGAVLDAVATAIRHLPTTRVERLPRMADFALWVVAAEPALGLAPGQFMEAYRDNRETAHAQALESCPISQYLLTLGDWTGRAADLLEELNRAATESDKKLNGWPKTPRALGGMLRRLAPDLRTVGVDVDFIRGSDSKRQRLITLTGQGSQTAESNEIGRLRTDGGRYVDANAIDVNPYRETNWTVPDGMDGEIPTLSKDSEAYRNVELF